MFCPECGKEIKDDSLYCEFCGSKIDEKEYSELFGKALAKPAAPIDPDPAPDLVDEPTNKFVMIEPAFKKEQVVEEKAAPVKKSKAGIIIACVCLCIVIVAGIFIGLHFTKKKPSSENENTKVVEQDEQKPQQEPQQKPVPAPEPKNDNLLDTMTANEKKTLNIFLSNFSEAQMLDYQIGMRDENYWLINFAFAHTAVNNPEKFDAAENYCILEADEVNRIIDKHFGKTVPLEDTYRTTGQVPLCYEYIEVYFCSEGGTWTPGDVICFSTAEKLTYNDDGTYNVEFEIFYVDVTDKALTSSELYGMELSDVRKDYMLSGSGNAVVKEKTLDNGKKTYELIEYHTEPEWEQ